MIAQFLISLVYIYVCSGNINTPTLGLQGNKKYYWEMISDVNPSFDKPKPDATH